MVMVLLYLLYLWLLSEGSVLTTPEATKDVQLAGWLWHLAVKWFLIFDIYKTFVLSFVL